MCFPLTAPNPCLAPWCALVVATRLGTCYGVRVFREKGTNTMGWTSQYRHKGITNAEFFGEYLGEKSTIVEHATVRGTFYAAVKNHDTEQVWALVCLTQWSRGDFNFSYKDMDETMGPGVYDAPKKVLDALTPTDNEYAQTWRQKCLELAERKARLNKALRGAPDGTVVVLARHLPFTDGSELDTFTIYRHPDAAGRMQIVLTANGQGYRVPGWRNLVTTVHRDGERIDIVEPEESEVAA